MVFWEEDVYPMVYLLRRLLFSLIKKEKATLVMVEKLCLRLKESRTDTVARKCAYCLSMLTHSEKTVRRVTEHLKEFRGKLQIPEVHCSLAQMVTKLSKAANNPLKVVVDELSAKMEECMRFNEDGEEMPASQAPLAATASQTAKGKAARGGRGKKKQPRRSYSDESE